jgi:hypothetical protein
MLFRHAGSVQRGAWHVVQAARGADRKTAADGIRAIIDEIELRGRLVRGGSGVKVAAI